MTTTPWRMNGEDAVIQGRRLLAELDAAEAALRDGEVQVDQAEHDRDVAVHRFTAYAREHLGTFLELVEAITSDGPGAGVTEAVHGTIASLTSPKPALLVGPSRNHRT
jgi:hypothetical protein